MVVIVFVVIAFVVVVVEVQGWVIAAGKVVFVVGLLLSLLSPSWFLRPVGA